MVVVTLKSRSPILLLGLGRAASHVYFNLVGSAEKEENTYILH